MNKEAFEKTIEYIKQAKDVIMHDWLCVNPICGTVGCIAGNAVLANKPSSIKDEYVYDDTGEVTTFTETAIDVLGLLKGKHSHRLFYVSDWPVEYQAAWTKAETPEDRKEVMIARLEYFMETEQ